MNIISTYTVGGNVTALLGSGLTLQINADEELQITESGEFTFATPLTDGTDFEISVSSQPTEPSQLCTVLNGAGTLAGTDSMLTVDKTINMMPS